MLLRLLKRTQAVVKHRLKIEPKVAVVFEIDVVQDAVEVGNTLFDFADLLPDRGQKLGDALVGGLIEVVEEAFAFLGERFFGQLPEPFEVNRDVDQIGAGLGKRARVEILRLFHRADKLAVEEGFFLLQGLDFAIEACAKAALGGIDLLGKGALRCAINL